MPAILESPIPPLRELKPYKSLSNDELSARIETVRKDFGPKLLILGHHYQPEGVLRAARRHRLHVEQRAGGPRMVVQADQTGVFLSRSASGPQHGAENGHYERADAGLRSVQQRFRRPQPSGDSKQPRDLVERALLGSSDVPGRARAALPTEISGD